MACENQLLPLCSIPRLVSRDGNAGNNAHIYLPFCGYHFFDGSVRTFPGGNVEQDSSPVLTGNSKTGVFTKGFSCEC